MININDENGRVFDVSVELKDNAMLKHKPELFYEWDFIKNDEIGLDIYKITKANGKKAWWICTKCDSSYDMKIANKYYGYNCSFCSGKKVNHTNSLASLNPELAEQWHPTLNEELTSHDVTQNSDKVVWWQCPIHKDHIWRMKVEARNRGNKCSFCSDHRLLKGYNDMWTTNPDLAKLLVNPDDGYKYMQYSHSRVNWKCQGCDKTINNKKISNINTFGLSCPRCSDGISFGEKIIYYLLEQLEIDFRYDNSLIWSKNKRYDFYLSDYNMIIEVHGGQHYDGGFERAGGRNLEEEQVNDKLKHEMALLNNIEHFIVVDARKSDYELIINSIMQSNLITLLDLNIVKWKPILEKASKNIIYDICDLWNNGHTTTQICEIKKFDRGTVLKYLKIGAEINICDYSVKESRNRIQYKAKRKIEPLHNIS